MLWEIFQSSFSQSHAKHTKHTFLQELSPYFLRSQLLYSSAQTLQTTIPVVPLRETHSFGDVSILYSATVGIWRKTIF